MRALTWVPVLTLAWLGLGGCFYVHDDDCESNLDCESGRVCQDGQCLDAEDLENSNGGNGGNGTDGENSAGGTSSEESSAGGTASSGTTGSEDDDGPSCEGIDSGTQVARVTDSDVPPICESPSSSVTAVFGGDSLLESLDGSSCELASRGYECGDALADTYDCGDCSFKVVLETVPYEGQTVVVGWAIEPTSCVSEGCSDYCCTSESGTAYSSIYWLPQAAPGQTTASSSSSGTSASSSGSNSAASGGNCAGCGYPFCDGECLGCC